MFLDIAEPDAHVHERMQQLGYRVQLVHMDSENQNRVWRYVREGPGRPFCNSSEPLTIVFDINGVLGCKFYDPEQKLKHRVHVTEGSVAFFRRPGARRLIRYCCDAGHKVVLWTSMHRRAAQACANVLIPRKDMEQVLVLSNEDAPSDTDCPEESKAILKDLRVVWRMCPDANPERTLIIDDDEAKTRLQPRHHLKPPLIFAPRTPEDACIYTDRGCELLLRLLEDRAARPGSVILE